MSLKRDVLILYDAVKNFPLERRTINHKKTIN